MKAYCVISLLLLFGFGQQVITVSYKEDSPLFYGEHTENFIVRWQYQNMCDHVFDPRKDCLRWPTNAEHGVTFSPHSVKAGDLIFVRDFDTYFKEIHPQISVPYIIISAGECLEQMNNQYKKYLDERNIIAWFGIHPNQMAIKHPKFQPIPLGVLQKPDFFTNRKQMNDYLIDLRKNADKKHLVYMNFRKQKANRDKVHAIFERMDFCYRATRKPFKKYMKEMSECKFVLSPRGKGVDCYRTWEALLAGSIPIVETSSLNELYEGLPILIVDNWEQITRELLEKYYKIMTSKKYNIEKLFHEYWEDKILQVKNDFLALNFRSC